ncbi:MAG: hypothetical protein ACLQU3_08505 [Limisphaerales bacterium]
MEKDLNYFRQLFLWLYDQSRRSYREPTEDTQSIVNRTYGTHRPISDSATLENCLPNDGRMQASFAALGVFLYLRPPTRASRTVPVISVTSNFGRSRPEVRIQLLLFLLDQQSNLQSLGYRFETPEGPGRHNYYHVQPIRTLFGMPTAPTTTTPTWFPDTHPTFPIDATDPVNLSFNLLISLYGPDCSELNPGALNPAVRDHLGSMPCRKQTPVRYWKVSSKRKTFFYRSWYEHQQFKDFCTERLQGKWEIKEIDAAEYSDVPDRDQLIC